MAPDVLLALVSAGAVLWVEDRRLRFRAPAGALDEELRAAAGRVRASLVALVRPGLPPWSSTSRSARAC